MRPWASAQHTTQPEPQQQHDCKPRVVRRLQRPGARGAGDCGTGDARTIRDGEGQRGAFRSWLRSIVCSRTADYWRAIDACTQASGGSGATAALQQLADPDSDLNRQWDEEHDRYVVHCLLDLVEQKFEPVTLQAFRRLTFDGASGVEVAQELGLTVAAVYVAKSRVLARIREEAEGLID